MINVYRRFARVESDERWPEAWCNKKRSSRAISLADEEVIFLHRAHLMLSSTFSVEFLENSTTVDKYFLKRHNS